MHYWTGASPRLLKSEGSILSLTIVFTVFEGADSAIAQSEPTSDFAGSSCLEQQGEPLIIRSVHSLCLSECTCCFTAGSFDSSPVIRTAVEYVAVR